MPEDEDKTLRYLNFLLNFSREAGMMQDSLLGHLNNTNYKAMDSLKPYIEPKKNIGKLLDFYEQYSLSTKTSDKIKIEIEKSGISENSSIKELEEIGVISKLNELKKCVSELREYFKVKIVADYKKKIEEYIEDMLITLKKAFFSALSRLPKVVDGIDIYAQFILKNSDQRAFLSEYTRKVYNSLGFFEVNNNLNILVQRTSNLTKFFNLVIQLNVSILGAAVAHNINVGLVQMIIINLKKTISETLAVVDKKSTPSYIPNLIKLYSGLKHGDGKVIKEIEDLFVFKEQILKIILNCLVQFMADLEILEDPREDLLAEAEIETMAKILDAFEENPEIKNVWVEKFGPSFGVYSAKELGSNFGEKCLTKAKELSESLKNTPKYVYLINNMYCLRKHVKNVFNNDLLSIIDKNCKIIEGLWRINLESKKGSELKKYLISELEVHRKYMLPEEHRLSIQRTLEEITGSLYTRKRLEGQSQDIYEKLKNVYMG